MFRSGDTQRGRILRQVERAVEEEGMNEMVGGRVRKLQKDWIVRINIDITHHHLQWEELLTVVDVIFDLRS